MRTLIGSGQLTWNRAERVTDRYGAVGLMGDDLPRGKDYIALDESKEELWGRLVAVIRETRPSGHIGDICCGHGPSTPEVGDEIVLGEGTLFFEGAAWGPSVGLSPDDDRDDNWLDPKALYRCHSQTVDLFFEEDQG